MVAFDGTALGRLCAWVTSPLKVMHLKISLDARVLLEKKKARAARRFITGRSLGAIVL